MMKKILVVDDQPDIRKLMRLTLGWRYQVSEAANAEEASASVAAFRPDLVLLDIMMPGVNGLEWCNMIKNLAGMDSMKIIFVSARGQAKDIELGMQAGATAYITKPFSPLELLKIVDQHLNHDESILPRQFA